MHKTHDTYYASKFCTTNFICINSLGLIEKRLKRVTGLQTATVFWLGRGTISLNCSMYVVLVMSGRQIHSAELLVPEPSDFETKKAIKKLTHITRNSPNPSNID
jgi:hypothetical protein